MEYGDVAVDGNRRLVCGMIDDSFDGNTTMNIMAINS